MGSHRLKEHASGSGLQPAAHTHDGAAPTRVPAYPVEYGAACPQPSGLNLSSLWRPESHILWLSQPQAQALAQQAVPNPP